MRTLRCLAALLPLAACNGPIGSCLFTTDAGYEVCEDFLGTEYNQSLSQNTCETDNGTYSADDCPTAGTLGTCLVGTGTAQDVRYTYTPAAGSTVSTIVVESACGVAGGTFTSG